MTQPPTGLDQLLEIERLMGGRWRMEAPTSMYLDLAYLWSAYRAGRRMTSDDGILLAAVLEQARGIAASAGKPPEEAEDRRTDAERIQDAFLELRSIGVPAFAYFMDCTTCGNAEMARQYPDAATNDTFTYAYFHEQDGDIAFPRSSRGRMRNVLYIHWGGKASVIATALCRHVPAERVLVPESAANCIKIRPAQEAAS